MLRCSLYRAVPVTGSTTREGRRCSHHLINAWDAHHHHPASKHRSNAIKLLSIHHRMANTLPAKMSSYAAFPSSSMFSSSSSCCVFHIKPLSFSPQQAAADQRTVLAFMSSSSLKSSPQSSPSLSSFASDSSPPYICRICRTEESDVRSLLSPCHCSGSLAHVHAACLLQWIESRPAADPMAVMSALDASASSTSSSLLSASSSSSVEPVSSSAHVCELCQSQYRIRYAYTANPMSCNRALLHLTVDSLLVSLLIALSVLLMLSLPAGTSALFWWSSVVCLSLLGVVSFAFVLRRYHYNNANLTLLAAEGEEKRRRGPERMAPSMAVQSHKSTAEAGQLAVGDEYVKLDCEQHLGSANVMLM